MNQEFESNTQNFDSGYRDFETNDNTSKSLNNVDDADYREIDESIPSSNHVTSEPMSSSQELSESQQNLMSNNGNKEADIMLLHKVLIMKLNMLRSVNVNPI